MRNLTNGINLSLIYFSIFILITGVLAISCEKNEIVSLEPVNLGNECDTNNVSFSKVVEPILLGQCESCHNDSKHYAGINLVGYDNVKSAVQSANFIGSFKSSMSTYFRGDDCDFAKIQSWINQGFKNN